MSGAEAALTAARLDDEIVHGWGLLGMVAGAIAGAVIGAVIIAGTALTGGMLLVAVVAVVGGCIAGGGLAGGALVRGISKAANLSGPTTGRLASGSPNVTVNSRAALRAGVDYADGCNGLPINHSVIFAPVRIAEGSKIVTVNGKPMARLSMKLECGAQIKTGSHNVTVGGPTARVLTVIDTEEIFGGALEILGIVALAAGGALAFAAAGLLGVAAFGGVFYGVNKIFEGSYNWAESTLGPGYGDIMVGVLGFGLLGTGARAAPRLLGGAASPKTATPRTWAVDPAMRAADESAGVLVNGRYIRNPTAKNINDLLTESRVGGKQQNGQFMYVIDQEGNLILGTRSGQRMPHPTLIGGENPQVLGAGIVEIRGGRIYSVNNESGHFKPGSGSLEAARDAFGRLPERYFHRDFRGYNSYAD